MKNNNKDHGDATNDSKFKTDEDRGSRASNSYSSSDEGVKQDSCCICDKLESIFQRYLEIKENDEERRRIESGYYNSEVRADKN